MTIEHPKYIANELQRAIIDVMSEMGTVAKDGQNLAQGYSFTSEAAIANTLRPLLVKNGLMLVPETIKVISTEPIETRNTKMQRVVIEAGYRLMHISGQAIDLTIPAEGVDSLDKAIPKALTMAYKYAMIQLFCIGRGDDPDAGKGYEADEKSTSMMIQERIAKVPVIQGIKPPIVSENAAVRAAAKSSNHFQVDEYVLPIGKHKGLGISTVDTSYLTWLMSACEKNIDDPSKATVRDLNKIMVDRILAEIQKRRQNAMDDQISDDAIPF